MIYCKTLVNIRKKHGYSQEEFAKLLGCKLEDLVAHESDKLKVPYVLVVVIRNKLKLHDAPITESERTALIEELNNWKLAIDYGDLHNATKLKPTLEMATNSSYSPSTEIFYQLYAADYYRLANDMESYNEMMDALSQRTDDFGPRHQYYYYCLVGARAFVDKRYQEAIKAYKTAAKADPSNKWKGVRFYFGMGMSLSDRGYAARALKYHEKAVYMSKYHRAYNGRPNRRFDVYVDGYRASDLSKLGKHEEALEILNKRLDVVMKKDDKEGIGYTYYIFGRVNLIIKDYEKAIHNFDVALNYLNKVSEAYMACIYHKAVALIAVNNISVAMECVNEGLSITTDEAWKILFNSLKHSMSLSDLKSLTYMKETIIPILHELRQYDEIVECYKRLRDFFDKDGNSEIALKYSNLALETHELLHKELIEGDM